MKKFELTTEYITLNGIKLFRIKALVQVGDVEAGELGGYVEREENLSHNGNAWVYGNAEVYGDARVYGDAEVYGNARVCGDARVYGDAEVCGNARVCGDAEVYGNARVCGDARVYGNAEVYGDARVYGDTDFTYIHGFGSVNRTTTFYRTKNGGIGVKCGCFSGTLDEFRQKVKTTHKDGKYAKEYLIIADLMEMHLDNSQN